LITPPMPDAPGAGGLPAPPPGAGWAVPLPKIWIGPWPMATWTMPETFALLLAAFGVQYLLSAFIGGTLGMDGTGASTISGILGELGLAATVVTWLRWGKHEPLRSLGLPRKPKGDVGLGFLVGLGLLFVNGIVGLATRAVADAILGHKAASPPPQTDILSGAWLIPAALLIVVLAPVCEETLFRGFLYQGLRRRYRVAGSVLISAAIFADVHVYLLRIPAIFASGILLALLYERRRSILATMVAHMTLNGAVVALYLARR
jgi:membrane protease YdiL (CAAX protease family)